MSITSYPDFLSTLKMATFCALPLDVILCILDFTTEVSQVCLALTCHDLYKLLKPVKDLFPRPRTSRWVSLLVLLERDMPHYTLCPGIGRPQLRRWTRDGGKTIERAHLRRSGIWYTAYGGWTERPLEDFYDSFHWQQPCNDRQNEHIPMFLARAVVNRHLYGEAHGPKMEDVVNLDRVQDAVRSHGIVDREVSRRARIIGDNLYVATVIDLWDRNGGLNGVFWYLGGNYNCRMMKPSPNVRFPPITFHSDLGDVNGCVECDTDWRIELVKYREAFQVRIHTWHCVGILRVIGELYYYRRGRTPGLEPGAIQKAWAASPSPETDYPGDMDVSRFNALWDVDEESPSDKLSLSAVSRMGGYCAGKNCYPYSWG